MESFNFGAFDTQLPGRIAAIPQEAEKQRTANMLQAMQMQGAMREGQMSQMKIDEMLAERKEIDATAAILKTKGYTPKGYFSMLLESRNPDRQKTGAEGLYRLNRQDEFNTLFKGSLGEMFGAAPAPAQGTATLTTDAAAATPPVSGTPSQAVPMPQAGGAQTNMLATGPAVNNLVNSGPTIQQMEQLALKMGTYKDVPGAETAAKLLEEKIKAARTITSGAPGSTILRGGLPFGTVPTEFEALLKSSGLSPDEMTAARKAKVGKEATTSYEYLTTLDRLGKTTDPTEREFLKGRLVQLSTHALPTQLKVNTFMPASEEAQKEFMKETRATYGTLKQSPAMFANLDAAKKLIPSASAFMGAGGEGMKTVASFLNSRLGMNINIEGVKDATELQSRLFQGIMDNLRKLDAQPSERQQAALQEALGSLATDPKALSNVLDAFADSIRGKIDIHNDEVRSAIARGVKFPYDPIIKVPAKATAGNVTTNPQYPGFTIGEP